MHIPEQKKKNKPKADVSRCYTKSAVTDGWNVGELHFAF